MKKNILFYVGAVLFLFSLQSCVSNYVVSATPNSFEKNIQNTEAIAVKRISKSTLMAASQSINANQDLDKIKLAFEKAKILENKIDIEKEISHEKSIDDILNQAETYIGTPYRLGGMSRAGIDCSAFVLSVFNEVLGMELPRVAASQAQEGELVSRTDLQKGDLIFFSRGGRISHVGIVHDVSEDGDVRFIHASTSRGVTITSLNDRYWASKFRFAKRIVMN